MAVEEVCERLQTQGFGQIDNPEAVADWIIQFEEHSKFRRYLCHAGSVFWQLQPTDWNQFDSPPPPACQTVREIEESAEFPIVN